VALAVSLAHFGTFFDPERSIATDVRYFVYFAWRIAEGAVPHLDLFDNKTFLASFVGALLYRGGVALGVEPLQAIRVGYLLLSSAGGLLAFQIFRRLGAARSGGARGVATGVLGLCGYLSFGLLGELPAVGNVPKHLMAVSAAATALLAYERRWLAAGVAGAVAFLDWQIGALAWVGAFAAAIVHGRPRVRAAALVGAGGAIGVAPLAAYYAARGALWIALEQTIVASFFRASTTLAEKGFLHRLERIASSIDGASLGSPWLFYVALSGLVVAVVWAWRGRAGPTGRLLLPLVIYHVGVVAFSLVDFQGYGDLLLLTHSVAFFLGILWTGLYAVVDRAATAAGRGSLLALVVLGCTVVLARPGPFREAVVLETPTVPADVRLSDQREVAAHLARASVSRRLMVLRFSELLFLMRQPNPLPLIYWNQPAYSFYGDAHAESHQDAFARILQRVEPDLLVYSSRFPLRPDLEAGFRRKVVRSKNGRYRVPLYVRRR
jgi:hypothetical protein